MNRILIKNIRQKLSVQHCGERSLRASQASQQSSSVCFPESFRSSSYPTNRILLLFPSSSNNIHKYTNISILYRIIIKFHRAGRRTMEVNGRKGKSETTERRTNDDQIFFEFFRFSLNEKTTFFLLCFLIINFIIVFLSTIIIIKLRQWEPYLCC